jgi:hypothetical protein
VNEAADKRPATRRSRWRFSLRELLLAMLAVAAFLGWGGLLYQQFQFFEPTAFFTGCPDLRAEVIAALQHAGVDNPRILPNPITHSEGRSAAHRTIVYYLPLSDSNRTAFAQNFQKQLRDRLSENGCKMQGNSSGNSNANEAFIFGYRCGSIDGGIDVCLLKADEEHVRMIVTMEEERAWREGRGFGLQIGRSELPTKSR